MNDVTGNSERVQRPLERVVICVYCNDEGQIEMDNNGEIGDCPICKNADKRPPKFGWAAGMYTQHCYQCKKEFIGDKRASMCADCAYSI